MSGTTGTISTDSALLNLFRDGQADGAILPQDVRNVVVSKVNVNDIYDDPSNASGLGAPAIIRGSLYADAISGIVVGGGQNTATQQNNATLLQNAITYCAAHNKIFEIQGTYEINSSTGLVIPANTFTAPGFCWRGSSSNTVIKQFYNSGSGAPVLTIGSLTGVVTYAADIDGMALAYGTSQAGLTNAIHLIIGNADNCVYRNIVAGSSGDMPAYANVKLEGGGGAVFSCEMSNWAMGGQAYQFKIWMNASATGNVWNNIYMSNGPGNIIGQPASAWNTIGGNYICFNGGVINDQVFNQVNCEWGAINGNPLITAVTMIGLRFVELHIEGILMAGSNPTLIATSGSQINVESLDIVDLVAQSSNMTGVGLIFGDYNGFASSIKVDGFSWVNNYNTSETNMPVYMYQGISSPSAGAYGDDMGTCVFESGYMREAGGSATPNQTFRNFLGFDGHMPVSSFVGPQKFARYTFGPTVSIVENAVLDVIATYTHYGQHRDATIVVPASITSFTITLAATMGATGNEPVATGTRVFIIRQSGTASGTLTIVDDAGTNLATNTTNAHLSFRFNGTHYVSFTPVT
jgi:hypothetical protein